MSEETKTVTKTMQIDEADLKFFTASALQGLLANPMQIHPNAEKYRAMKGLTLEKLAVESALETMIHISALKDAMEKDGGIKVQQQEKY